MSSLVLIVGNIGEILTRETAERLTAQGIKFLKASEVEGALNIIQNHSLDLVLTEIQLKGADGFELFKRTKTQNKGVPFIFVSNNPSSDERMQAMFVGGKAYLEKPIDQMVIEQELVKALQKAKTTTFRKKTVSLKGNLKSMAIPDILQMIVNYQKSGALRIKKSGAPSIYFINGEIMDASWSDQIGQATLLKIIGLPEGDFEFEEYFPDTPKAIEGDWMGLVMEGLRVRDEVNLMKTSLESLVTMEEMIFLEEVIYWGYSSREQIVPIIQNKETHVKVWDFLLHYGIINAEIKNFLLAELKKNTSKVVATKKITQKIEQKKLAEKLKSQFQIPTPEGGTSTSASSKLKKTDTTQQKFSKKQDTLQMRLAYIHASSESDTAGSTGVSDNIFQRLLLALSLISPDQLNQCVQEQVRLKLQNIDVTIPELLVSRDLVDESTIHWVAHLQNERGESLIPGYNIKKLIGEGGLAAVYRGVDLESEVSVAIKVFAPPMSDTSTTVVRFIRECEVIKSLEHPNIVKAYDFGEFYGLYYIVMEFLEGVPLSDKIINEGAIPQEDSLAILEKVSQGLYKAWSQGFIHRDIKPANIMVGENFVKLCDFGLAKSLDSNMQLTQAGTILGTPHYMSPEQLSNDDLDFRTDVYSLGVTFYAMLTAHLPFGGSTSMALTQSHLNAPPPLPDKFRVTVSKPTVAFLMKILSKKKEDRCGSPDDFLENIRRAKQGLFPRGGVSYFRQEKIKRIKVASLIIFFVLAAYGVYYYVTEVRARAKAVSTSGLAEVKKQEAEAQKRLEEEKKRKEKELEKQRSEAEAEKERMRRAGREAKEKEEQLRREREKQERLRREREKKAKEEKENRIIGVISNIKDLLTKLKFKDANEAIFKLEYDYPSESRVKNYKEIFNNLSSIDTSLQKGDIISTLPLLKKHYSDNNYIPSIYFLLWKHLEILPFSKKQELLKVWLELGKASYVYLAESMEPKLHYPWLTSLFLSLPSSLTKEFFSHIYGSSSIKLKNFVQEMHKRNKVTQSLKNFDIKQAQALEDLLEVSIGGEQVITDIYPVLSQDEKKNILKTIPKIARFGKIFILLVKLIQKEKSPDYRIQLAQALYETGHSRADNALINLLSDEDESVRFEAIKGIGKRELYEGMEKALDDESLKVRSHALSALIQRRKSRVEEILIGRVSKGKLDIRMSSISVLGRWKVKKSFKVLCGTLKEKEPKLVKESVSALGKLGDPAALTPLFAVLETQPDYAVGEEVVRVIGSFKTSEAYNTLIKVLKDHYSYRDKSTSLLVSAGTSAMPELIEAFKTEDRRTRRQLGKIFEQIGSPAVSKLCDLLNSVDDKSTKKELAKILGSIGDKKAAPYLIKMLKDRSTKYTAKRALRELADKLSERDPVREEIERAIR